LIQSDDVTIMSDNVIFSRFLACFWQRSLNKLKNWYTSVYDINFEFSKNVCK